MLQCNWRLYCIIPCLYKMVIYVIYLLTNSLNSIVSIVHTVYSEYVEYTDSGQNLLLLLLLPEKYILINFVLNLKHLKIFTEPLHKESYNFV